MSPTNNITGYRALLRDWIADRKQKNPRLSLRAIAQRAGMAPSMLNEVLSGKKNLSAAKALSVARKLGMASEDAEHFSLLAQAESTSDLDLRSALLRKLEVRGGAVKVTDLNVDQFRLLADWYHLPLLQLANLSGFKLTAPHAATRLGISRVEAEAALERLERLELVTCNERGEYQRTSERTLCASPVAASALRQFHREMLTRAIDALENQTPQEKWVGTETMAIDPAQLPEAGRIIEECFQRLTATLAKGEHKTEVYHLSTQFFRVTRKEKSQ